MNSESGKKTTQPPYSMKGVMEFVQEQSKYLIISVKNTSNEWTQEKNLLIVSYFL